MGQCYKCKYQEDRGKGIKGALYNDTWEDTLSHWKTQLREVLILSIWSSPVWGIVLSLMELIDIKSKIWLNHQIT